MATNDHEQVEELKQWWDKNGKLVIGAVIAVLVGVVGGQAWRNYDVANKADASMSYDMMLTQMETGQVDAALSQGAGLIEKHADSSYAVLAAMAMAKMEVDKGELESAGQRLSWALEHAPTAELGHIVRTRLVRVLIELDRLDQAMSHASLSEQGNFSAIYSALRGDIYVAKGDKLKASKAYEAALAGKGVGGELRNLIQMKKDNLGIVAEAAS